MKIKTILFFVLLSMIFLPIAALDAKWFFPEGSESLVGKKAPEFTVKNLLGENVSLSSFKGKPILLNFWATWCPYCRKERPYLNSLYKEYKDKGLVIISVSTDNSAQKVKSYIKNVPMDFLILHDNEYKAGEAYGVYSLPTTFLIGRGGIVKNKFLGLRDWTDSETKKLIEKLLLE